MPGEDPSSPSWGRVPASHCLELGGEASPVVVPEYPAAVLMEKGYTVAIVYPL